MADTTGRGRARIEPFGDSALLVVLGDRVDRAVNDRVHRLAFSLHVQASRMTGLGAPVPAYASVLVPFDPSDIDAAVVRRAIELGLRQADEPADGDEHRAGGEPVDGDGLVYGGEPVDGDETRPTRDPGSIVRVPVHYGGADGPDLAEVAARTGRSEDDVVRIHAGAEYRVFCVGFVPGFPYLGLVPEALALPRRPTPRLRVPAGSVAIAGRQTGIYPSETPGGWHVIGRTEVAVWDPSRDPPGLLAPAARVRFVRA